MKKYRIVSNQVRYSLMDRSIEVDLLRYCQESRITIIAYSPLGHGLDKVRRRDPKGVLGRVAAMTGKTEAQVALNWCISKEGVVAIPKASSIEHVAENCYASGWKLTPQQVRMLDGIKFRCRGWAEVTLRRLARRIFQNLGSFDRFRECTR